MLITGTTTIKEALTEHPELKEVLLKMSPKFSRLNNKLIFRAVSRWATFNDVARIGKLSICEVLHTLNDVLGTSDQLLKAFPECIREKQQIAEIEEKKAMPDYTTVIDFDTRERTDYFLPEILEKLESLEPRTALRILSNFDPIPLKKMFGSMNCSYETNEKSEDFFETFVVHAGALEKTVAPVALTDKVSAAATGKVPVVLQSATPIAWPIILKLLESRKLLDRIEIKELKVWRKTEKHLGWIVSGKADISFSALLSSAKLYNTHKLVMPAIVVWDNFRLLTRGYKASSFSDVLGHEIYTPLFKGAPPYVLTRYLMKREGVNPDDFTFKFGKPFGRPDEIKESFVRGKSDTVILREPESSFALFEAGVEAQVSIDYGELWNTYHPELNKLPNAGLLFKGEFVEQHPDIAQLVMQEVEAATIWVNGHPRQAAEMSAEAMGVTVDEAESFINRATLKYKKSTDVQENLRAYLEILKKEEILKNQDIEATMGLFEI